ERRRQVGGGVTRRQQNGDAWQSSADGAEGGAVRAVVVDVQVRIADHRPTVAPCAGCARCQGERPHNSLPAHWLCRRPRVGTTEQAKKSAWSEANEKPDRCR